MSRYLPDDPDKQTNKQRTFLIKNFLKDFYWISKNNSLLQIIKKIMNEIQIMNSIGETIAQIPSCCSFLGEKDEFTIII